ncbi:MAG: bifunctional diaminohydroxyphosphoribosylaminopyrimidine deaminase/5-amino-6-(5-phosphoribosylamino)uracil reductase RibD [Ignavibacteriaceae bacterium]
MTDESYIKLTLEIAKKGIGFVSPNPLVGAVLVKEGKIIGAGYHQKYGEAHAEVNAINSASESVEGATLFVNLEPCSHFGKTPPCVDALLESKIKKVVIGTLDMNPIVCGNGIQKLKDNGVEVKVGILENECVELNKFFFKNVTKKTPYVTLKSAITIDGKIADASFQSKWITSTASRKQVHKLRNEYDAVLIGANTVNKDDPQLTVRLVEGRNPKRIILDPNLKSCIDRKIFHSEKNVLLVTSVEKKNSPKVKALQELGVKILFARTDEQKQFRLKTVLKKIGDENITSILVEGGAKVYNSFIKENLFDEMQIFIAPKLLGSGIQFLSDFGIKEMSKARKLSLHSFEKYDDDLLLNLRK